MAFWIKVDVIITGAVTATIYDQHDSGGPRNVGSRFTGTTASQAIRALAASLTKAEKEQA